MTDPKSLIEQLSTDAQDVVLYGQFGDDDRLINTVPESAYQEPDTSHLEAVSQLFVDVVGHYGLTLEEAHRAMSALTFIEPAKEQAE